ncbi:MAG TPA: sensor domain-containing protein, partial [Acidimicrobiales bacterium]
MTTTTSPQVPTHTVAPLALLRRWYSPLVSARTWKETAALLLTLPAGIVWFTVAVTALSVSASLMITVIGLPLLLLALRIGRVVGAVERASARTMLDTDLPGFAPISREGTAWTRIRGSLADGPSWKGIAYA